MSQNMFNWLKAWWQTRRVIVVEHTTTINEHPYFSLIPGDSLLLTAGPDKRAVVQLIITKRGLVVHVLMDDAPYSKFPNHEPEYV